MELKPNKDWTDAIRESYSSDAGAPDAAGWEAIERRLHRAVVLRRTAIAAAVAAAVLLPLSVLLIRGPWQNSLPPAETIIAHSGTSPVLPPSGEASGDTISVDAADNPVAVTPAALRSARKEQSVQPVLPEQPMPTEDPSEKTQPPVDKPVIRQIQEVIPEDLWAFAEEKPKQRKKVSVSLNAGTSAIRRDMMFNAMSAPYYAKLAYMNTAPAGELTSIINADNINANFNRILTKASNNANMPNPSTPADVLYVHDLPLSFGLLARLSLLPWLGVESGVEYTYLHSVADSYTGTLDQRLHFIGIPLLMDARIWSNNYFEVYAGLGGKVDKCISANLGQIRCEEPRLQWSVEAAGGIQYRLWDHLSLYFQPELSLYLTQTDLITYRTEHPLCFALVAGLRFNL